MSEIDSAFYRFVNRICDILKDPEFEQLAENVKQEGREIVEKMKLGTYEYIRKKHSSGPQNS